MKPKFLSYEQTKQLRKNNPDIFVHNQMKVVFGELFDIKYPVKKDTKTTNDLEKFIRKYTSSINEWGNWVYYPWLNKVVHFPPSKELYLLRTARNRNLITFDEQMRIKKTTVLISGMSVGSNVVEALVSQGVAEKLLLADIDIIEPTNLNRIRSPFHHVGLHKVDAISRKIWEIDPYIQITQIKQGLSEKILSKILTTHKIDIIVDEMDDLRMKIILREQAKKYCIPVIMAADDGDSILLDIERYDLNSKMELLNGRIPQKIIEKIKKEKISRKETGFLIGRYFVETHNIPLRMYQSLQEVGKSLPSWPQLGTAATFSGISVTYCIRKILLGEKIFEGRLLLSFDEKIDKEHLSLSDRTELKQFRDFMDSYE